MKTTNIVLIGVVGVGAVGAYMYMKNKKAENALLSGSLPATTPSETPPLATTPLIPTPNLTEPVKISSDTNLDNYNLQKTVAELEKLDFEYKNPPKKYVSGNAGNTTEEYKNWYKDIRPDSKYKPKRDIILQKLSSLGYKYDNGLLVKI